jgi:hypothetical protein
MAMVWILQHFEVVVSPGSSALDAVVDPNDFE